MTTAQFEGQCANECGQRIRPGEAVFRASAGWAHDVCPGSSRFDIKPNEVVCESCFTIKPCPCEDGL